MTMTPLLMPLILLGLVLILVALAVCLTPMSSPESGVNRGTRFFLVMLRLAIGWHFLFEGVYKWTTPTWSSDAYLRGATGPLASSFHELAGDRVKDQVTVLYDEQGKAVFPNVLDLEWGAYLDRFTSHHDLSEEQQEQAEAKLAQAKNNTLKFLTVEKRPVQVPSKMPPSFAKDMTVPERVALYESLLKQAKELEDKEVPVRGKEASGVVQEKRAAASRIRAGISKDLDQQAEAMRTALREVLTDEQKRQDPPTPLNRLPVTYLLDWSMLTWVDIVVMIGLVVVGILLILGLLTRTACVGGALLLLMFFLPMPPLPGLPPNPLAKGHYLYINENIIEMLALLALATTRSGRWVGLDGLLQLLRPRGRRVALPPRSPTPIPEVVATRPAIGPHASATPSKEITHGS
jgi:uncharacterized membrane protein YphA (DoxX/SURF4 family)